MKKKLFISIIALFVFCCMSVSYVNATIARAPETIPDEGDKVYAILDEDFDFSKIKFQTDGGEVSGKNDIRKILLTTNPDLERFDNILGESWFAAYCLDGNLKYPQYGVLNFQGDLGTLSEDMQLQVIIMSALANNPDLSNVFKRAEGYILDPTIDYDDSINFTTVMQNINNRQTVVVNIESITYPVFDEGEDLVITAADLSGKAGDTVYPVTIKFEDVVLDLYNTTNVSGKDYNHAMWIIEHSYPTLSIEEALNFAGANIETLKTELATLIGGEVTDEVLDNYVYSTIQYAIWKVTDGVEFSGNKLGDSLIGSAELNKLYQYLIQDREEYNNYLNFEFNNTFSLIKPDAGKEIFKETKEYYLYGPYSVSNELLSFNEIAVTLDGTFEGVSIVDNEGNAISAIGVNEKFYVKTLKDKKIANVAVKLSTDEAKTFFPNSNRGRIYYANYPKSQNVISGGKIVNTEIDKSFDLVFNPKTGQETFAIMFVVMLVLCSTAFVYVTYKNNPLRF